MDQLKAKSHVSPDLERFSAAVGTGGDRAGLLVSGDLRAACQQLARELLEGEAPQDWSAKDFADWLDRSDALRALCAWAVSEEYFQARQQLGLALAPSDEERQDG